MWMAAPWDPTTGNYAEGQDWYYSHSTWEAELVKWAKLCIQGLQDMKTCEVQQRVSSIQCPMLSSVQRPTSVADEDFMLVFTTVSKGIMAHGPVLAHVRQCGHDLAPMWCLPTCYNFDRSAWVALSDLAVGLAENPERTVGIILRTWPPNWPLRQRVYHCKSAIQCLRHRPTGHVAGLRHAEHSAAAVSSVQREAARMPAASTTTIAASHHPPKRPEAKAAWDAMVVGVYMHKLEDLCPASLRHRVAPRPHTTCRGRGSGSGPSSCTRAQAICR